MKRDGISTIRFKTLNCGGISGSAKKSFEKRKRIFNSVKETHDITILTETKFKKSEMNKYKQDWNSGLLASCTPELHAQAGVAFSHHYQGSIDFNTVNIQRNIGMYFLVFTGNRVDIGG